MKCFIYDYFLDESNEGESNIRAYGIDENNENVCLHIGDYKPYLYLELPRDLKFEWTKARVRILAEYFGGLTKQQSAYSWTLVQRFPLYGANLDANYKRRTFPYVFCEFHTRADLRFLLRFLHRPARISGLGEIKLVAHELDADPVVQMTTRQGIPRVGWLKFKGKQCAVRRTHVHREYEVSYRDLRPLKEDVIATVSPLCMFFDIEVYSSDHVRMPTDKNSQVGDKVFMISCIFWRDEGVSEKVLLTLNSTTSELCDDGAVEVRCFANEYTLLEGFVALVQERQPNLICGYNILGYDISYMLHRAETFCNCSDFRRLGFHRQQRAKEWNIKWRSNAMTIDVKCVHMEGRLIVDLLPLIRRDFKLNNFKLKTVAEEILGDDNKIDLSYLTMFKMFAFAQKNKQSEKAQRYMGTIGKYCLKDAELCQKLFVKLQVWLGLTEMARIMNASVHSLYTQGQQFKIFTQVYKFCVASDIVIDKQNYNFEHPGKYAGAHVFPPVAGIYENVVPFDFSSLYPSIMIAYNLDYTTWVRDEQVPDRLCNVIDYEEHEGCSHDPKMESIVQLTDRINSLKGKQHAERVKALRAERIALKKGIPKVPRCGRRYFRFFRGHKGVIPSILDALLKARNVAKAEMKKIKEQLKTETDERRVKELTIAYNVYNNRQLSYKTACNSMYGGWGVVEGYLPFLPGAICTTHKGRVNIEFVREIIETQYKGSLVYGDTDSVMMTFKHISDPTALWDYCVDVANAVSKRFPPPMKLEFENKIYHIFLILTKKRYITEVIDREGKVVKKFDSKGVLTTRRDNCAFIQQAYADLVSMLFRNLPADDICEFVQRQVLMLVSRSVDLKELTISKSIRDVGSAAESSDFNEVVKNVGSGDKGVMCGYIGAYKVKMLPSDTKLAKAQIQKRGVGSALAYYLTCLPAHVQLAIRMMRRGSIVSSGSRIPYIITRNESNELRDKLEDLEYYEQHNDVLEIDTAYYVSLMVKPFDEVLALKQIVGFMARLNERVIAHRKLIQEINNRRAPLILYE